MSLGRKTTMITTNLKKPTLEVQQQVKNQVHWLTKGTPSGPVIVHHVATEIIDPVRPIIVNPLNILVNLALCTQADEASTQVFQEGWTKDGSTLNRT